MTPRRARQGATALEFALVLPLLAAMLFAVVDWSWFMFHHLSVAVAAQRGVRLAAGVPRDQGPDGVANDEARVWLERFGAGADSVMVSTHIDPSPMGEQITVEIQRSFDPIVGLVPTPDVIGVTASGVYYGPDED